MTTSPETKTLAPRTDELDPDAYMDEVPGDVEMSIFDHLEELRMRIFYSLIAVIVGVIGCFAFVEKIVQLLEVPAKGAKFLQLSPGEYFFVSLKVAGYSGLLIASPFILYQIIMFVLPGLTRRERRVIGPIVLGSSVLFLWGSFLLTLLSFLLPSTSSSAMAKTWWSSCGRSIATSSSYCCCCSVRG